MQSLLVALRQETKDTHNALHKNSVLSRCQEGELSLSDYVLMLMAFYQPWKALINSVDQVPIPELRPLLIRRYNLLYTDLLALGVDKENLVHPKTRRLSQGELLGISYVVIGSSMGAALLAQNIKTALGNEPVSYLSMSPQEAGWPLIASFLKSNESKDYPDTCAAASTAFKLIETHLEWETSPY